METAIKPLIIKILNIFENDSGSPNTEYNKIYIYRDGPGNKKQVTLGRGYTECGGALWKVFEKYKELKGKNADKLLAYRSKSCKEILPADKEFLNLIISSAESEKVFRDAEDYVYDQLYYNKGLKYFTDNGFKLPLSLAVIEDSYLHSGGMLNFLVNKFPEKKPIAGGDEKKWIKSYVQARYNWLSNASPILQNTVYRPNFFLKQIANDNWNLDKFPIYPNGVKLIG